MGPLDDLAREILRCAQNDNAPGCHSERSEESLVLIKESPISSPWLSSKHGLRFAYLVTGGTNYHAFNHSQGVAKLSELCLQLNAVVFTRVVAYDFALMNTTRLFLRQATEAHYSLL